MKVFFSSLCFILILLLNQPTLNAQGFFEGRMKVEQTNLNSQKNEPSKVDVFFSAQRIKLESSKKTVSMEMLGAEDVGELLIRLDKQDVVLYSKDMNNEALKISKLDIENMMNMIKNMSQQFGNPQQPKPETKVTVKPTNEQKKLVGFKAKKSIVTSNERPDEELHVWITSDINVNLGMLTENWDFLDTILTGSTNWLKKGEFPLLIETYRKGKMISKIEVTEIKKGKVDPTKMDVPKGVQLLSFQDMLMKKMMQGQ